MEKYIDIHCHLQQVSDIDKCLLHGKSIGIKKYICNSANVSDWLNIIEYTKKYDYVYGAIGVHPWVATSVDFNWYEKLEKLVQKNPNIMIGEIGLDKNYPDIELQTDIFIKQIGLASKYKRVLQIHCVGAWDLLLNIFKTHKQELPQKIILHSFNSNSDIVLKLSNVYFSYSKFILDDSRYKIIESVKKVPMDKILVESDGIDFENIPKIVEKISEIKNIANEKMCDIIYANSIKVLDNG